MPLAGRQVAGEDGRVMKQRVLWWWCLSAGLMDTATGILLVMAPAWTLALMSVPAPGLEALPFVSWLGVFVAAVGSSYLLALWPRSGVALAGAWRITTWFRLLVAAFLGWKIAAGELAGEWWPVAVTDGMLAAGQWLLWRLGWLGEGRGD